MAKIFVDLDFAKQFGLSEKDFAGKSEADQEKTLDEAYKKFKKTFSLRNETENFENAKTAVPKIKEFLHKQVLVYVKPHGVTKGVSKVQIVGYSSVKDKVLAINPESVSDKLKVLQFDTADFILSADELVKYQ